MGLAEVFRPNLNFRQLGSVAAEDPCGNEKPNPKIHVPPV
jgi:hypothetical protein